MITRYRQLHRHAPDEGLIGDCWRTCIACILGLKPQQVPHFVEQAYHSHGIKTEQHVVLANEWLKGRNLTLLQFAVFATDQGFINRLPPHVPYILTGAGDSSDGMLHCVVARGAREILWDPSPWRVEELKPVSNDEGHPPYYWLDFLVPINLAANPENR